VSRAVLSLDFTCSSLDYRTCPSAKEGFFSSLAFLWCAFSLSWAAMPHSFLFLFVVPFLPTRISFFEILLSKTCVYSCLYPFWTAADPMNPFFLVSWFPFPPGTVSFFYPTTWTPVQCHGRCGNPSLILGPEVSRRKAPSPSLLLNHLGSLRTCFASACGCLTFSSVFYLFSLRRRSFFCPPLC